MLSGIPRSWVSSLVLALALFATAELVARVLMAPLGDRVWTYWNLASADRFEWYRTQSERGETPAVVVTGDSTAAYNFRAPRFETVAGVSTYNLAWPANFPTPYEITTLPALASGTPPKVVMMMEAATAFLVADAPAAPEQTILGSLLARQARGEPSVPDYLALSRLRGGYPFLVRHWIEDTDLVRAPAPLMMKGTAGLSPEQVARTRANEIENAARLDVRLAERGFDERRRAVVTKVARLARQRGFELVVVVTPVRTRPMPKVFTAHRDWLVEQAEREGFTVWDYLEDADYTVEDFHDGIHLRESAVQRFSELLAERYRREFE